MLSSAQNPPHTFEGGLFLLALGILCLIHIYNVNVRVTLDVNSISIEKSFFGLKRKIQINFTEIEKVSWRSFTGTIEIHLKKGNKVNLSSFIARTAGELADHSENPEIPAGGPKRETFNLNLEMQSRIREQIN